MKKLTMLLALSLFAVLVFASSAYAIQAPYTHGDFASNSKGCGDCHVTHSADVQKLLRKGYNNLSTQTALCIECHGRLSPFDVNYGIVMKQVRDTGSGTLAARFTWGAPVDSTDANMSLAGGFSYAGDFDVENGESSVSDANMEALPTKSVHNVRGIEAVVGTDPNITTYEYVYADDIPGGTGHIDFECGSCHDPHAGGAYENRQAGKNPRLLKANILEKTGLHVEFDIDQAENLPTSYYSGINEWCGACHDLFDTSSYGATASPANEATTRTGYIKLGGRQKYMHLFGIAVNTGVKGTTNNPYNIKYLALDGSNKLICLTCHRAHGSSAASTPNWARYQAYKDYSGSGTTTTGQGSALLRLKERDVCYACHGAAQFNHSVSHN